MDLSLLMFDLCADLGFCVPSDDQAALVEGAPLDVEGFLLEVLRATDTDVSEVPARTMRRLRDLTEDHFRRQGIPVPERAVPWIDVEPLLYDLCVKLGFCLPPDDLAKLTAEPPRTVDDFAAAVFIAEGMEPWRPDGKMWLAVRDMNAEHFAREGVT